MALIYLELKIDLPYSQSLKDKRGVIKSITSRISKRFNVSISEIDHNDIWKSAVLGIAIVANNGRIFDSVIENITAFIELNFPDIRVSIKTRENY